MVTIILAVLTSFGIIFILLPVFLGKKEEAAAQTVSGEDRIRELNEHKKVLFTLLKDLEFEFKTGKLSTSDFEKLHEEYKTKVILIYQEIDHIAAGTENASTISANNG
ncbi:MAG: hypothetical protein PHX78_00095 [bacterium]|nr:hypothetical protein [bacterium]